MSVDICMNVYNNEYERSFLVNSIIELANKQKKGKCFGGYTAVNELPVSMMTEKV